MKPDYIQQQMEEEHKMEMEKLVNSWIRNGVDPIDANQLLFDMENDPFHADADIITHLDPTIDDRFIKYSKRRHLIYQNRFSF